MTIERSTYAKFLAFMQLSNPELHRHLVQYSNKADVVEARLICANNFRDFHALVFSDGPYARGDRFEIEFDAPSSDFSSWDWRWVFALHIYYQDLPIFPLKFQQQIIAVPPGVFALSAKFFNRLMSEFTNVVDQWISKSNGGGQKIKQSYLSYIGTTDPHLR